jgi:hypothetical protein
MKNTTDAIASTEKTFFGGGFELHTDRTLSTDLEEIANGAGFDIKIIMRNETDKITNNTYFIVNLDTTGNLGTHWVGLITTNTNAYYCDSFGVLPPQELYNYLLDNYKNVYYNSTQYQDDKSSACGLFAMSFLIFMIKNKFNQTKFNTIFCKMFNYKNLKQNDKIVVTYLNQYI